jgi:hypothetical protein
MRTRCNTGTCARCKYWKLIDYLRGECLKEHFRIACSHSCCDKFVEIKER